MTATTTPSVSPTPTPSNPELPPPDPLAAAAAALLAAFVVGGVGSNRATDDPEEFSGQLGGGNPSGADGTTDVGNPPIDTDPNLPADASAPDDLGGVWTRDDAAGTFYLAWAAGQLRARRGEKWVCRPGGPVKATASDVEGYPETDVLFEATRQGDNLAGQIQVCWHGGQGEPYWAPAPLRLAVSDGRDQLSGAWHDEVLDREVNLALSHAAPERLTAEDFGLPAANLRIFDYGIKKVFRQDGIIASVRDDYAFEPEVDAEIVRDGGIDFTSRNEQWVVALTPFTTPVAGTIYVYPNSQWNTVAIRLETGDWLQFLHASEISVQTGERVEAGTILGKTGTTGTPIIHLHVQAKDANGNYLNPDRVVDQTRRTARSTTNPSL